MGSFLTDPFLQNPSPDGVSVVWMTDFPGVLHLVLFGSALAKGAFRRVPGQPRLRAARARTRAFSRLREDARSQVPGVTYAAVEHREVFRHEAVVHGLEPGVRVPYRVVSLGPQGRLLSPVFTLAPAPPEDQPLTLLLTSDHQLKPNTPANLQMAAHTAGRVDAVLCAGDLVNVPDRASEWFDDSRGRAFFPCLQGRANHPVRGADGRTTVYRGGELIQHAPLFPLIGNHEVMGCESGRGLSAEFSGAVPVAVAERAYLEVQEQVNPKGLPSVREAWIRDHSFNTLTYQEMFTLPGTGPAGGRYYATTFGSVRLIALCATRSWRRRGLATTTASAYGEAAHSLGNLLEQGWGTHLLERIDAGSEQYLWLQRELRSDAYARARTRIVMLHHPIHTLGDNAVPAFVDPVRVEERSEDGRLVGVRYEYPREGDVLLRDVEPLLLDAGVDLVINGHSHLFNRFRHPRGTHFLETSNVGNSYGAFTVDNGARRFAPGAPWRAEDYVTQGDPGGLLPIAPSVAPHREPDGTVYPFVASNDFTVFSLLDTGTGDVTSYVHDVRRPEAGIRVIDVFNLRR